VKREHSACPRAVARARHRYNRAHGYEASVIVSRVIVSRVVVVVVVVVVVISTRLHRGRARRDEL